MLRSQHQFSQQILLSNYYVPTTVLRFGDTGEKKADKAPAFRGLHSNWEGQTININNKDTK